MNIKKLINLIKSDLYRYTANTGFKTFIKYYFRHRGFKITFYYRICHYLHLKNSRILLLFFKILLYNYQNVFNMDIFPKTQIGSGLHISHGFGIVIHSSAILKNNVNISHGVTIGIVNRGSKKGVPTIGNNVFIGPNACILGNINIGDNVAIGANSVVMIDVPDNSVVAGIPGKIVSQNGSEGYIENTDYNDLLNL